MVSFMLSYIGMIKMSWQDIIRKSFAEEMIRKIYSKKSKEELIDKIVELLTGEE